MDLPELITQAEELLVQTTSRELFAASEIQDFLLDVRAALLEMSTLTLTPTPVAATVE